MTLRSRIRILGKRLGGDALPPTVILTEAVEGQPPGRVERTNAAGLPVLELAYDREGGPVALPPPPYKLVAGTDPVDLV